VIAVDALPRPGDVEPGSQTKDHPLRVALGGGADRHAQPDLGRIIERY
jgi:hypothetical protein